MKKSRQEEILRLISSRPVETQEQLLDYLREKGYAATQATISRDIKDLRLVKRRTENGGSKYAAGAPEPANDAAKLRTVFLEGVVSAESVRNILVIRTMPGVASGVGAAVDSMDLRELVGSLAGNDTVLLIMRTDKAAEEFCAEITASLTQ